MRNLLCLFLLSIFTFSNGQKPFFQAYSLLKKKEPITTNTVFQNKAGFIWFGTDKGLFKFDGVRYQHFSTANGLPNNNITAIAEDSLGRLWTGHSNGDLATLENGVVKKFETLEGHASKQISDILFDKNGNLWFSTLDDGLYYYANSRLYRLDEMDGMPDLFVYDIDMDDEGKIWAGTDRGVVIGTLNKGSITLDLIDNTQGLPDNIIRKVICDKNKVWMGSEEKGLISFDRQTKHFTTEIADWNFGSSSDLIISENEAWIATSASGLLIYDLTKRTKKIYRPEIDKAFATIHKLLPDREGNIWLAGAERVIRFPGYSLEHLILNEDTKEQNVISLALDRDENFWYSLNGKLFFATHSLEKSANPVDWITGLKWDKAYVSAVYVDSLGYVWVGSLGQGIIRINPITRAVVRFDQVKSKNILSITGIGSTIWAGSLAGAIQFKVHGEKLAIKQYDKSNGLSSDYIYQIFIDSKKRVWFGTDGSGVDMLDEKGLHHFEEGFTSKVVLAFAQDRMNRIWANTQSDGLYLFDGSRFSKSETMQDKATSSFGADEFGNLALMYDFGMSLYNVDKSKLTQVGDELGLSNFKPYLNANANSKGALYFGTDNGVIRYKPRAKDGKVSPVPVIEDLKVVDKTIFPSSNLHFNYNENEITINYTGLWYQNAEALRFKYQLVGFDRDWILSSNRVAVYSDLPPGSYSFRLKVSDSDLFDETQTTIDFTIFPPFWRTPLFYILWAGGMILLGYTFIKYRERKLRNDKLQLQMLVEERTAQIQMKNEEISAQAEEIKGINENLENLVKTRTIELEQKNKALEEYAFITAHELRAPLASILGLVNVLCAVKLEEKDKVILDHLKVSSQKLEQIVRTVTEAIEKGDSEPQFDDRKEDSINKKKI